jgi:hypothetical protein
VRARRATRPGRRRLDSLKVGVPSHLPAARKRTRAALHHDSVGVPAPVARLRPYFL